MTENNYACKDSLWAHCGALGDALRRASEAERKVEELKGRPADSGARNDLRSATNELAVAYEYNCFGGFFDENED